MSTDREFLELAAKAAGIGGGWGDRVTIGQDEVDLTDIWFLEDPEYCASWNPLTDDGDALRLAGKLEMDIYIYDTHATAANYEIMGFDEDAGNDIQKAIRRAIVRVAAAIGESMP